MYISPMLRTGNELMLRDALPAHGTMLLLNERFLRFCWGLEIYSMVQDAGTHGSTHLRESSVKH